MKSLRWKSGINKLNLVSILVEVAMGQGSKIGRWAWDGDGASSFPVSPPKETKPCQATCGGSLRTPECGGQQADGRASPQAATASPAHLCLGLPASAENLGLQPEGEQKSPRGSHLALVWGSQSECVPLFLLAPVWGQGLQDCRSNEGQGQGNIFKLLGKNKQTKKKTMANVRILYPLKSSDRNEDEIKTFSLGGELGGILTSRLACLFDAYASHEFA